MSSAMCVAGRCVDTVSTGLQAAASAGLLDCPVLAPRELLQDLPLYGAGGWPCASSRPCSSCRDQAGRSWCAWLELLGGDELTSHTCTHTRDAGASPHGMEGEECARRGEHGRLSNRVVRAVSKGKREQWETGSEVGTLLSMACGKGMVACGNPRL